MFPGGRDRCEPRTWIMIGVKSEWGGGGGGDGKGLISCFNRYGSSFVEQGCPSLEVKKVL